MLSLETQAGKDEIYFVHFGKVPLIAHSNWNGFLGAHASFTILKQTNTGLKAVKPKFVFI